MAEDADDKKKAKAIRQMKKTEQQGRTYQKFKFKRGLICDGGGISRLQVPMSLPTAADYDDSEDYDLEDPKSTNQKDPKVSGGEIIAQKKLNSYCDFGIKGTPFTGESMKHKFNRERFNK
jgi:hypothetical protein